MELQIASVKPYSKKELATLYDVSRETFRAWLKPFQKEIGVYLGRRYTPAQVKIIFARLGEPANIL